LADFLDKLDLLRCLAGSRRSGSVS